MESAWFLAPIAGAFLIVNVASIALTRCRLLRLERRVGILENLAAVATATAPQMPQMPIQTVYYPPLQQPYRPVIATAPPAMAF
jgi:hypothetical protein